MKRQRIELEHVYPHPIQEVWEAISNAEAISKWFIKADFQPRVGYAYTFTHESSTVTGTVLRVEPPSLLSYTWIVSGVETTVTWELTKTEDGTLLKLVHAGIEQYADTAAQMFKAFSGGWETCVADLDNYLTLQNA